MTHAIDHAPQTEETRLAALEGRLDRLEAAARSTPAIGRLDRAAFTDGVTRADRVIRRWYAEQPVLTIIGTVILAAILFKIID